MAALTCLLVLIGGLVGGQNGMLIFFAIALAMNFISYWFSDKIVLKLYRAQPLETSSPVHRIVQDLAQRSGLPMPKLYQIPTKAPNAFATGRNPQHAAVAVTQGILEILTEEELQGVLAHELSHIKNRDTLVSTVAASIAGAIMLIADAARWAAIFTPHRSDDDGPNPISLIVMAIVAPFAAMLIQMAISRSREFLADETGARITHNPKGLATALQKISQHSQLPASPQTSHMFIVNPLRGTGILSLFSTHPPLAERVRRLEKM